MNTNEKCLLKYLSDYSKCTFEATGALVKFLFNHNRRLEFNNFNPVYNIIDEMELNYAYEQEKLD